MELILISLAAFCSSMAVFISAQGLYSRWKAGQRLLIILTERLSGHGELVGRLLNPNPSIDALRQGQEIIESAAALLSQQDRRLVLRGLHQRSNTGRTAYIVKLVGEAIVTK